MVKLTCLLFKHIWITYKTGWIGRDYIERQWCPDCKSDRVLFSGYEVERRSRVWISKNPWYFYGEFDIRMKEAQRRVQEMVSGNSR